MKFYRIFTPSFWLRLRIDAPHLRDVVDDALSGPRTYFGLQTALMEVSRELEKAEIGPKPKPPRPWPVVLFLVIMAMFVMLVASCESSLPPPANADALRSVRKVQCATGEAGVCFCFFRRDIGSGSYAGMAIDQTGGLCK